MTKLMDYTISSLPIRIAELTVDPSRLRIAGVHILQIGHLPGRKLRRVEALFDCWALAYIAGGRGTFRVDDGPTQTLGRGAVFFVYPGASFSYGPEEGGTWEEYYVRFQGVRVEEWLRCGLIRRGAAEQLRLGAAGTEAADTAIIGRLNEMLDRMESGSAEEADRAAAQLESLLLELAQRLARSQPSLTRSGTASDVLNYMADRLQEPLEAEGIAAANHISVPTLRRLVSKQTGYSLHEYLHRLRVAEAKKLLLTTDMPVKEIARLLQYDDPLYFSRVFKRMAGVSASEFRTSL
ncbi:AraC family transcriptional regulator [Paenibacillus koleovorans]|uniref:AraC family transcriptional regulator n=1 Tax=Paenibacillus koleovorans TaxID=121608 RepID=UPI0013E2C8C1|nr:AraC family transcriptional regulator [Paenibacillus koleovorans]